jgi:hypothetical protein
MLVLRQDDRVQTTKSTEIDSVTIVESVGCCSEPRGDVSGDNLSIDAEALCDHAKEIGIGHGHRIPPITERL